MSEPALTAVTRWNQ